MACETFEGLNISIYGRSVNVKECHGKDGRLTSEYMPFQVLISGKRLATICAVYHIGEPLQQKFP
jgi:hypothetical protein